MENQWDLLAALDIAPPDRSRFPVEMAADQGAAARVADRLSRAGVQGADPLVVVHVSAGNPFRRWPAAHFVDLVGGLATADPRRRIVVTSGPSEGDAAATVIAGARARLDRDAAERVLSCGEFSLAELRALLDRAALYIGGDSGPLHIAATTRVPIVGLYGPTLPVRSAPWRDEAMRDRVGGRRRAAVPAVRPAGVRAGRFPLPDVDSESSGRRGRRARAAQGVRIDVTVEISHGTRHTPARLDAIRWTDR